MDHHLLIFFLLIFFMKNSLSPAGLIDFVRLFR